MSHNTKKADKTYNDESINIIIKTSDQRLKKGRSLTDPSIIQEQIILSNTEIKQKNMRNEIVKTDSEKISKNTQNFIKEISEIIPSKKNGHNFFKKSLEDPKEIFEENQKQENSHSTIIPRYKRCFFFIFIVLVNICVNLDEGNMPAATEQIQHDLKITPSQLGLFGSLQYSGNSLGSLVAMIIIDKYDRKILLIIFLILTGLGLWAFTITRNIGFLYFDRIILGVFQSFITIYCPVWVDQFGPRNRKTVMMSFLQIGSPFGVVLGYTLTTIILRAHIKWQFTFIIQAIIFGLFVIINVCLPKIYFSKSLKCINPTNVYLEENKRNEKNKRIKNQNQSENNKKEFNKESESKLEDVSSLYEHKLENDDKLKSFWRDLSRLVKIKVYMICVTAISVLLFISCAIQFWTTNYLLTVMKIDSTIVTVAFISTCITAPTSGIIIGGCIVQKLGGYESRKSLFICCIYGLCAVLCGIPIILFESIVGFAIFLWLFLFFGGCVVPNLIGIILSALPKELRAAGNSITVFFNTIMGFLPAPYTYGIIHESTRHKNPKFAYGFIIMYSIVSLTLMIIGAIIREKEFKIKMKEEKEKEICKNNNDNTMTNVDKSVPFYNSNSQLKLDHNGEDLIENNDATKYVSNLNVDSERMKSNLNQSEDLIENVSKNEVFINKILDNSIKVKELKISRTKTTNSVNKTKESFVNNNQIFFTDTVKNIDTLINEEKFIICGRIERNHIEFNTMKYENEEGVAIEREFKSQTVRNDKYKY